MNLNTNYQVKSHFNSSQVDEISVATFYRELGTQDSEL
jgi:hypothetical protein